MSQSSFLSSLQMRGHAFSSSLGPWPWWGHLGSSSKQYLTPPQIGTLLFSVISLLKANRHPSRVRSIIVHSFLVSDIVLGQPHIATVCHQMTPLHTDDSIPGAVPCTALSHSVTGSIFPKLKMTVIPHPFHEPSWSRSEAHASPNTFNSLYVGS